MFAWITRPLAVALLLLPNLSPTAVQADGQPDRAALAAVSAPEAPSGPAPDARQAAASTPPEVVALSAQLFDTRRGVFVDQLIGRDAPLINADAADVFAEQVLIVATVRVDDFRQVRVVVRAEGQVVDSQLFEVEGEGIHHLPLWHRFDPCEGGVVEVEVLDSDARARERLELACTGC